jgi:ubiquinone/menaquinone biosynthesis C-methylase UbiE
MLMNRIETAVVNSPLRRGLQRLYEAPLLVRLGGRVAGGRALQVGCGSGEGTRLILDTFGAARADAVGLDPAMVERARRRLTGYGAGRVRLAVGSVTDLREAVARGTAAMTRCSTSGSSIMSRTGGPPSPRPPGSCGLAGGSSSRR